MHVSHEKELAKYKAKLIIDGNDLDTVVAHQPALYYDVASITARRIGERDSAELDMKQAYAQVSLRIREEFADEGKKATEALIDQSTRSDDDYLNYQTEWLDAKEVADNWIALEKAFAQRTYMIKEMAALYMAGYYTASSIKGAQDAVAEIAYEKNVKEASEKRALKQRT